MSTALAVALGGAVGAPLRYLIDLWVTARRPGRLPWGTLSVNVIGTFVLGLVLALSVSDAISPDAGALLGTGVCGALTTYSTFSIEVVDLIEHGASRTALGYVALSLLLSIAAALLGWGVGDLLT